MPAALLDGARRAMRASFQREMDAIESHLSFLASVGSVSPYVGLFGTVWGIMHAFIGLSNLQQVTLATVAPGIAEALVATAIGLFAAIPRSSPTTASRATSTASPSSRRPSSRSSPTSCTATPARPARRPPHALTPPCRISQRGAAAAARSARSTWCPFIDVMLVLLIIFMVTAPLITTGLVDLPSVGKSSSGPTT
jgi:hypothetical protein